MQPGVDCPWCDFVTCRCFLKDVTGQTLEETALKCRLCVDFTTPLKLKLTNFTKSQSDEACVHDSGTMLKDIFTDYHQASDDSWSKDLLVAVLGQW